HLADAIDGDRAVRGAAPKDIAPERVDRVAVSSGIYDERLPERRALNAEQVRVAVSCAHRTAERSHVENEVVGIRCPAIAHDGIAAFGEDARARRRRWGRGERLKALEPGPPEQPDGFRRRSAAGPRVVGPTEHGRGGRKDP